LVNDEDEDVMTKAEMMAAVKAVIETAGCEEPESIIFWCKEGGARIARKERAFEPCEGCDCGWADLLKEAEVDPSEIRDRRI